jgi:hypothetical protein
MDRFQFQFSHHFTQFLLANFLFIPLPCDIVIRILTIFTTCPSFSDSDKFREALKYQTQHQPSFPYTTENNPYPNHFQKMSTTVSYYQFQLPFLNCSSKLIKMSHRYVKVLDSHLFELSGPLVEFSTLLSIQYHLFCQLHCKKKKPLNNSNTYANSIHKL